MELLFLICLSVGGSLLLAQLLLSMFGLGADHGDLLGDIDADHPELDHNHDSNWLFGFLSVRTVLSALTFFGLGGMTALQYDAQPPQAFLYATVSGFAVFYAVGSLMKALKRLKSDGTVRLKNALGKVGTVYLRVPANNEGPGKVTLNIQNRTVELEAYTLGSELATGTPIRVTNLLDKGAVAVEAFKGGS